MEYRINSNDAITITIPKKVYEELQKKVKEQNEEIKDLKNLIQQGDICETSSIINSFRNDIRMKGADILLQMTMFPIGVNERRSLLYLTEELEELSTEFKKILGVDADALG